MSKTTIENEVNRFSSPIPLRSPTPDYSNRSGIIQTKPLKTPHHTIMNQKLPLGEELRLLRQQNNKLKQTIKNKAYLLNNNLDQLLKDKDRIINDLKSQLKSKQMRSNNKGLQLISNSNQKPSISNPQQEKNLIQQNQHFESKIKKLINQNQQLKNKRSSINNNFSSQKVRQIEKDQPLSYYQQQIPTNTNLQKLKIQLGKQISQQFNVVISQLNDNINVRLYNIEDRVNSIENKIFLKEKSNNSTKKVIGINTIDNLSPIVSSNINMKYGHHISSFTQQQDQKILNLNNKIQSLQLDLKLLKLSQQNLKYRQIQLQQQINIKNESIRALREQIFKKISTQEQSISDNFNSQNFSLKQKISQMGGQLTILRNDRINLQRQYNIIKQQLNSQNKLKTNSNHQLLSIKQTLIQLRNSYSNLLQELQFQKQENHRIKTELSIETNKTNINLKNFNSQSEITKLKLKILQLQKYSNEYQYISKQFQLTKKQLTSALQSLTQLKNKQFQLQNQNIDLRKQVYNNIHLKQQIQMLKTIISDFQNSRQQILKGSNHSRNEIIKLRNQTQCMSKQIIQLKYQIKIQQNQYQISQNKLNKLSIDHKQTSKVLQQIQLQNTYVKSQLQLSNLTNNDLQNQINISNNEKQHLFEQINSLKTKLIDSSEYFSNTFNNQNIKNNQLRKALEQLLEVKRLLQGINFDSISEIYKQLQIEKRITLQQSQDIKRSSGEFHERINKLLIENQNLRKQSLTFMQKLIEQKQKIEHLSSSMSCLNDQNTCLKQRINKLQEVIQEYVSSHRNNDIMRSDEKQVQSHYYVDEVDSIQQINKLKQPIHIIVNKLDFIAQKIGSHVQNNQYQKYRHQDAKDDIQRVQITSIK